MAATENIASGIICEKCLRNGNVRDATHRKDGTPLCDQCDVGVAEEPEPVVAWEYKCLCGQRKGHRGRCKVRELRRKCREAVLATDALAQEGDKDGWNAALFIMAPVISRGALRWTDTVRLSEWLGLPLKDCQRWSRNMFKNGLWTDEAMYVLSWGGEHGAVEFWLHVLCARGEAVRVDEGYQGVK